MDYWAPLIFVVAYVLFVLLPEKRSLVAVLGACFMMLVGSISVGMAFEAVNWNVMGIFCGTLIVADIFMESRMPAAMASWVINRLRSPVMAMLALCALTGFVSAFVENVATVMIVAPVAFSMAKKLSIKPVNLMIAIAVSSNLQGAATLIGDPPSMLLAANAKMNFFDFFIYKGRPGVFWAIEIAAAVSLVVLYYYFKKDDVGGKQVFVEEEKPVSLFPTVLLTLMVGLLAVSSFIDKNFKWLAGTICLVSGTIALMWAFFTKKENPIDGIKKLDWDTAFFLVGVFILVGGISESGWLEKISHWVSILVGKNILGAYVLIILVSLVVSAFVDNVPYLAAMMPVVISVSNNLMIEPYLFLIGLLIGASIGGNITPIGASANIVACGMLKKEGYKVSFMDFARIGVPFTLASTFVAAAFVWFVWK